MKAILMSIQSKWLCEILDGLKTAELRKRFPKDYRGWVYLYCTKGKPYLLRLFGRYFITDYLAPELAPEVKDDGLVKNGLVVARVWVDNVEELITLNWDTQTATLSEFDLSVKSCVSIKDLNNNFNKGFAIHFSKLKIFDKPKELEEFSVERYAEMPNGVFPCYEPIIKAPQSWQYIYIEEDK